MEGLQKLIGKIPKDPPKLGSASASFDPNRGTEGFAAALSSSDQSCILLNRPARQLVSLWTCSKFCTICFVAGVVVGYTLKRRVQSWTSKLLKKIRDD
ncbi:hypothetical protein ACFX11_027008 [Malus domestica]